MSADDVAIVFRDHSLGGTSRSALQSGSVWRALGFRPTFIPLSGVHPSRRAAFESAGRVAPTRDLTAVSGAGVVHFHHAAWDRDLVGRAHDLVRAAASSHVPPALVSTNVFAVRDAILDSWPGPRATIVLGHWAAAQYRAASPGAPRPWVVGNAQDDAFFRMPDLDERRQAQERWVPADATGLLVRVGSPIDAKWSQSYVGLARSAMHRGVGLVLVGAPPRLVASLPRSPLIKIVGSLDDDTSVREAYWAADAMVVNAERGESFGNVVFESLLCGTPVVYRARPYRDNTPWELRDVPGFTYSRHDAQWIHASIEAALGGRPVAVDLLQARYGMAAHVDKMTLLWSRLRNERAGHIPAPRPTVSPSARERVQVAAWHNPAVSALKDSRRTRG